MKDLVLGKKGAEAFERRGIGAETVARLNVYTGKFIDGEVVPHEDGNIIVFPFIEHGVSVNEKFRGPQKKFWQRTGGRKTFWNSDALDDPALADGRLPLVITEGEIDALTAIDCGWPLSVSVPDGAPPAVVDLKDQEPTDDSVGKYEFLWNNRDRLKPVKRFIIAVDNDPPGQRLAEELVRRLSAARCLFVTYPTGCKDLNEVLMQHGADRVREVLSAAQPYPVRGLFTLSQYPDAPAIKTYSTGWETLDKHCQMFVPMVAVVTGIPGMGKSTFMTHLMINMAELHGWQTAVFSPEMPVMPFLRDKMRRIVGRSSLETLHNTPDRMQVIDRWIDENFIFIDHDGNSDDDISLDWIIDRAEDAVLRYGIRMLIIDPWNEIEHAKRRDESMTEYIGRGIRSLRKLSRKYNLAIFVLAHPTKDVASGGSRRVPSLYDIDGSAHWNNKPDLGLVVDRPDPVVPQTTVYVSKVRFEGTGEVGKVLFSFDKWSSRYGLLDEVN